VLASRESQFNCAASENGRSDEVVVSAVSGVLIGVAAFAVATANAARPHDHLRP
jgi:hypothetical protein